MSRDLSLTAVSVSVVEGAQLSEEKRERESGVREGGGLRRQQKRFDYATFHKNTHTPQLARATFRAGGVSSSGSHGRGRIHSNGAFDEPCLCPMHHASWSMIVYDASMIMLAYDAPWTMQHAASSTLPHPRLPTPDSFGSDVKGVRGAASASMAAARTWAHTSSSSKRTPAAPITTALRSKPCRLSHAAAAYEALHHPHHNPLRPSAPVARDIAVVWRCAVRFWRRTL